MPGPTTIVTLTDRRPVKVAQADWPIVAEASGDSYRGPRGDSRYQQALNDGALHTYALTVRQHQDGRALVYGVLTPATFTTRPQPGWRGGMLLADGEDIARAVRTVGTEGDLPDAIIRECIANLPPEEL